MLLSRTVVFYTEVGTKILLIAVGIVCFPGAVWAYVDPGAGSLLLQGIFGAVTAGIGVAVVYWRRVRDFLIRRRTSRNGEL